MTSPAWKPVRLGICANSYEYLQSTNLAEDQETRARLHRRVCAAKHYKESIIDCRRDLEVTKVEDDDGEIQSRLWCSEHGFVSWVESI